MPLYSCQHYTREEKDYLFRAILFLWNVLFCKRKKKSMKNTILNISIVGQHTFSSRHYYHYRLTVRGAFNFRLFCLNANYSANWETTAFHWNACVWEHFFKYCFKNKKINDIRIFRQNYVNANAKSRNITL